MAVADETVSVGRLTELLSRANSRAEAAEARAKAAEARAKAAEARAEAAEARANSADVTDMEDVDDSVIRAIESADLPCMDSAVPTLSEGKALAEFCYAHAKFICHYLGVLGTTIYNSDAVYQGLMAQNRDSLRREAKSSSFTKAQCAHHILQRRIKMSKKVVGAFHTVAKALHTRPTRDVFIQHLWDSPEAWGQYVTVYNVVTLLLRQMEPGHETA